MSASPDPSVPPAASSAAPADPPGDDEKIAVNRANWDERARVHLASDFYDIPSFVAGDLALRDFEIAELGPVEGKDLVHLQCHFGLDTLSWARLGARVTGLDFSPTAVEGARRLADEVGLEAEFVCADVYGAVEALGGRQFDVVYTGLGALCWLPDLDRWSRVLDALLRPGGIAYVPEFHPVSDMLGDQELRVEHDYFGPREGLLFDEPHTYGGGDTELEASLIWDWIHPVSEVVTVLLDRGLVLESFHEFPFTLFERWPFLVRPGDGTYRLPKGVPTLPLVYSLRLRKPA